MTDTNEEVRKYIEDYIRKYGKPTLKWSREARGVLRDIFGLSDEEILMLRDLIVEAFFEGRTFPNAVKILLDKLGDKPFRLGLAAGWFATVLIIDSYENWQRHQEKQQPEVG
jgi:hypothetical protein